MALGRRTLLAAGLTSVLGPPAAEPARYQNLEYRDGRLCWAGGSARASAGCAGISADKKEGDGATPTGSFPLVAGFYRADRLARPRSGLPMRALAPSAAWADDPADASYNGLVALPHPRHAEPMWLADAVYDLLVVIGYNMAPVVPGAGSAIFLHVARPDFAPTAGCIAVEKAVLLQLVPLLGPGSTIAIRG